MCLYNELAPGLAFSNAPGLAFSNAPGLAFTQEYSAAAFAGRLRRDDGAHSHTAHFDRRSFFRDTFFHVLNFLPRIGNRLVQEKYIHSELTLVTSAPSPSKLAKGTEASALWP
ncbi:hypothetical protein JTE90_022504 [Oedothorax gibbosus]|uniref:Uncharacterized protein n=1 Tax=Oedothorax gibbosus TaxID=931172 RepID=A0AAV6UYU7_9ARAC|nr:hypothetical protein JTE90_022504 [Oedothorax gibbosus]